MTGNQQSNVLFAIGAVSDFGVDLIYCRQASAMSFSSEFFNYLKCFSFTIIFQILISLKFTDIFYDHVKNIQI